MNEFKHFIFRHYWWTILLAVAMALAGWLSSPVESEDWQVPVAVIGGLFSLAFFIQKQKLDELKLFRELFSAFNERYKVLNDDLERISSDSGLKDDNARRVLIEYFNLCAEEYFWYRNGLIPLDVWEAWSNGMSYYFSKRSIAEMWVSEAKGNSYYGFSPVMKIGGDS